MRVLVTGAGGMLAKAVTERLIRDGHQLAVTYGDADDADAAVAIGLQGVVAWLGEPEGLAALGELAETFRPDAIVHLAAWTDVDRCEADPERALRSNAEACRQASTVARARSAQLVAVSTDYVFDGRATRPYVEDDPVGPISVYGRSKLAGERLVRETWDRHLILRSAWLYGEGGRNFVDTIRERLERGESSSVVNDQRGSPTWTVDLADAMVRLLGAAATGTFHVVNSGDCTWYELACAIAQRLGVETAIEPTTTAAIARPAPRPAYSVLDCSKYERTCGACMPQWRDALQRYLSTSGA